MKAFADRFGSPAGEIGVAVNERGDVVRISFLDALGVEEFERELGELVWNDSACAPARAQLEAYFRGERRTFELELAAEGTPFQLAVWDALRRIPFGQTRSYGELARDLGQPGAARAVGRANHQNPIAIVVPCHRVIGADGTLTGFGGGLDAKRVLLDLERGQRSMQGELFS